MPCVDLLEACVYSSVDSGSSCLEHSEVVAHHVAFETKNPWEWLARKIIFYESL